MSLIRVLKITLCVLVMGSLCRISAQSGFIDVTAEAGIEHRFEGYIYGGGVACGDFDNDGFPDLFIPNGPAHNDYLYMNNGDGTFTEMALEAGIDDASNGMGAACADIDNDGDLDLFVTNFLEPNQLYINDGLGHFAESAEAAGVAEDGPGTGVAFADYNNDSFLDIYVLNQSDTRSSVFYRNNGDGTFDNVTEETGTHCLALALGVVFFDYDLDGDVDLLVLDEFYEDYLFRNNGDGTFTNVAGEAEENQFDTCGMGVDIADVDSDGDFDILVGDYYDDPLFINHGDGTFSDEHDRFGIDNRGVGWGVNFLDCDNDGDKDVYIVNGPMVNEGRDEANVFYTNDGAGNFKRTQDSFGAAFTGDNRGSVTADFDQDGYPDLFFVSVLRGQSKLLLNRGGSHNWISLELIGTKSNRNGVGARIELTTGNQRQIDEVRAGSSYASMHSIEVEFGLGDYEIIDEIRVYWPSGNVQSLKGVAANQRLSVTEANNFEADGIPQQIALFQNYPNPFNNETTIPFFLEGRGDIELDIISISGQGVYTMSLGEQAAGEHHLQWNGRDNNGAELSSGVYFYRIRQSALSGGMFSAVRKLVLIQ